MVCRWDGGGGVSKWGDVCPVNGGDRERLLSKLSSTLKILTEEAVTTEAGSLSKYFTNIPKMPTLPFGGGSYLGVPCKGALLCRVEREGGRISSDQYPKGP